MATLAHVKEFVSIKVSSFDHAALATSLTTKATEGWDVVSVVSVGNDIVAYLSRETSGRIADSSTTEPAGWAGTRTADTSSSAPTQIVPAAAVSDTESSPTSPNVTPPATTPSVPADWYKDPSGRYEYRYWDGQKWTEHVSRAGTVHKDPPTP